MTRRYYVSDLPSNGGLVPLPTAEAQHALRVMRVSVGDSVILFDGQGRESTARIETTGRNECICTAEAVREVDRELPISLHLAIALPKPDRAREMIERLTEIGVAKVTPLIADRTQRPPSDSLIGKLQRSVIEACKQCERNRLLEIDSAIAASGFFQQPHPGRCLIAQPGGNTMELSVSDVRQDLTVAIGPEGGFSEGEVDLALKQGFNSVGLGPRIYRVETAATVVASMVSMGGVQ